MTSQESAFHPFSLKVSNKPEAAGVNYITVEKYGELNPDPLQRLTKSVVTCTSNQLSLAKVSMGVGLTHISVVC